MKDMWERDCFLRNLDQLITGKKIVSFDIFDTLLFRGVAEPADLFEILGRESAALGYLDANFSPKIFKNIRKMAEQKATLQTCTGRISCYTCIVFTGIICF